MKNSSCNFLLSNVTPRAKTDYIHRMLQIRIVYKFCKALFPRMWTRWCTALNVKKMTSRVTLFLWSLLEDFLKAIISLCCCYRKKRRKWFLLPNNDAVICVRVPQVTALPQHGGYWITRNRPNVCAEMSVLFDRITVSQ